MVLMKCARGMRRRASSFSGRGSARGSDQVRLVLENSSLATEFGLHLHLITPDTPIYRCQDEASLPFDSPFWGFLWPGGRALTRFITENPVVFRHKRVLDVGSGCGASAMAALRAGAASVVANDICPYARTAFRLNLRLNDIPAEAVHFHDGDMLGGAAESFRDYDIVLCGDMMYDEELSQLVQTSLGGHPMVLVGDPQRGYCPQHLEETHEVLASYDYGHEGFPWLKVFRLRPQK